MTQINDIRKAYFEKGLTISAIAREYAVDRKTVRRYVQMDDWNVPKAPLTAKVFSKLAPYKAEIDQWLQEDKKARKKQRHTAKRIYDRLRKEYGNAFDCSYRTVAGYVAGKKKEIYQNAPGYLPLEHIAGEAQVDFGKAEFYENGIKFDGFYLNVSFPHSNGGYLQLFKGENQECLFEGLTAIFQHLAGVPHRLWFDNASTLVKEVLKEGNRSLTDAFLRFKQHYGFDAAFCNPNAGHEKGSVENKVGYHRRNFLVPLPRFERLEEFNRQLLLQCDEDMQREHYRIDTTIHALFEQDKRALLPLPTVAYDICDYITVKTNGYAKLSLGKHLYSTAPKYANTRILVKVSAHEVIPLDENYREIVRHRRLYGDFKQESMNWLPYLTQLARKPGALKYSGIYTMLPGPLKEYLDKCGKADRGKVLQVIALLSSRGTFDQAVKSVAEAIVYGVKDLDSLIAIHQRATGIQELPQVKLPENTPILAPFTFDAETYDQAFLRGERVC